MDLINPIKVLKLSLGGFFLLLCCDMQQSSPCLSI